MRGRMLYSPIDINKEFNKKFNAQGWHESRYQYYITTDPKLMNELIALPYEEQKYFLIKNGIKRTNFFVQANRFCKGPDCH